MATATLVTRTVIDHEPNAAADITVAIEKSDPGFWILLKQGDDIVAMRVEQAEAVHAALGACVAEFKALSL